MTTSLQLEASHTEIMDIVVATVEKATETEEDTPLFRHKLQKVLGIPFIAAATKKDRNLRPLVNFVKKRDWDAIKASYGQYWFNIRNRLHVREDCLLVDERIVIPSQLRQTVLDSLHLTHPGSAAMLDLSQHVWFPHIHRSIVQMAQNCKHCTEQGKNLKPILGKNLSFQMEPVFEPNEEVQLDFAGPLPDDLNRDAYILVAIDKWSKFPTAKIVSNTTADIAIKFMQRYNSNNGVSRRLPCDQAQTFRAKKFQIFCRSNNIKLLFAPVDDHRAIGVVERMIQTIKRRLEVMRIDPTNTPYKLASDVAEIIKTLRNTPHVVTKISPFEAHMGRKPNTPLSNIATNSSPNNLNWESAKHACLDRKNLVKPPLPAEVMHDLERWSEDEVQIRKKETQQKVPHEPIPRTLENKQSSPQQKTGAYTESIDLAKNKLNLRFKGVQQTVDKNIKKRIEQVARKTIRLATKVKKPKNI